MGHVSHLTDSSPLSSLGKAGWKSLTRSLTHHTLICHSSIMLVFCCATPLSPPAALSFCNGTTPSRLAALLLTYFCGNRCKLGSSRISSLSDNQPFVRLQCSGLLRLPFQTHFGGRNYGVISAKDRTAQDREAMNVKDEQRNDNISLLGITAFMEKKLSPQGRMTTQMFVNMSFGLCVAATLLTSWPSLAATKAPKLPPLSKEPNRCEKAFIGNTIGQANGVYDKPLDLRFCDYTNDKSNLKGKALTAALMSDAKFDGADMSEVIMSKAYAVGASFKDADFTNAVIDRVNFGNANLEGAKFRNTVLSGSTFDNANLENALFEDALIGYVDLQKLCTNSSLSVDTKTELGCKS
eukprot:c13751_g1_i2 orf=238-1293(-)